MIKNLLIPKKICPKCKQKSLRVHHSGFVYCPNVKCKTSGKAYPNYQEMKDEIIITWEK